MTILERLQAAHPEAEGISDARNIAEAVACINGKGGRGANAIAGKLEDIIHSDNIAAKIAAKNEATDARNIAEAMSGRRGSTAIADQFPSVFTITFDPNGASGNISPIAVVEGESFTLPSAEGLTAPAGSTGVFSGWDTPIGMKLPGESYTPTGDTIIYALWPIEANV